MLSSVVQVCRLLYSQNHSQILPDFVYDSVNKTNHALVKDTYVDQATPVVQATTSEARGCLRADFRHCNAHSSQQHVIAQCPVPELL